MRSRKHISDNQLVETYLQQKLTKHTVLARGRATELVPVWGLFRYKWLPKETSEAVTLRVKVSVPFKVQFDCDVDTINTLTVEQLDKLVKYIRKYKQSHYEAATEIYNQALPQLDIHRNLTFTKEEALDQLQGLDPIVITQEDIDKCGVLNG